MKINIQPNDQETRVCLIGELDTTATTNQVDELNQVLAIADKALEIDCEQLENASQRRKAVRFASPTSMRT